MEITQQFVNGEEWTELQYLEGDLVILNNRDEVPCLR